MCKGITSRGTKCKRSPKDGYCHQHTPKESGPTLGYTLPMDILYTIFSRSLTLMTTGRQLCKGLKTHLEKDWKKAKEETPLTIAELLSYEKYVWKRNGCVSIISGGNLYSYSLNKKGRTTTVCENHCFENGFQPVSYSMKRKDLLAKVRTDKSYIVQTSYDYASRMYKIKRTITLSRDYRGKELTIKTLHEHEKTTDKIQILSRDRITGIEILYQYDPGNKRIIRHFRKDDQGFYIDSGLCCYGELSRKVRMGDCFLVEYKVMKKKDGTRRPVLKFL